MNYTRPIETSHAVIVVVCRNKNHFLLEEYHYENVQEDHGCCSDRCYGCLMLTGCALTDAVRDKAVEKALESKLSGNGVEVKVSTTDAKEYKDVVKAVKKELTSDANKNKVPTEVVITTTATKGYVAVVVKASNKSNNVKNDLEDTDVALLDRKSTRLNSSHPTTSRMPSSA